MQQQTKQKQVLNERIKEQGEGGGGEGGGGQADIFIFLPIESNPSRETSITHIFLCS